MEFCTDAASLRKALEDIERAEANGFKHCLAVFRLTQAGHSVSDVRAEYSDLVERGHPTDRSLNWGRFQGVTRMNVLVNGKLKPLS